MMFHVVLYQPEIPPNPGNIIRLCANTGSALHLIRPLGFELDDRRLRRAGLDYREWATVREHDSLQAFRTAVQPARCWAFSTRGRCGYDRVAFGAGDAFLFGPETRGLPDTLLEELGDTADGRRQPQPEPGEHGGGGSLRGVATTGLQGCRLAIGHDTIHDTSRFGLPPCHSLWPWKHTE